MITSTNTSKSYLLKLSIPFLIANMAIPFVGLVDTALMGHLSNEKFLAAISIATSVVTMILWSFGFLRMSTVGLVSQALGSKNHNEAILILVRNIILASFIGIIIIFFKGSIISLIELFFETSEETQNLIKKYISIRILSAPAELLIFVLAGFYLGMQKTYTSSLIISIFCFSNAILSAILVVRYDLEIFGVAAGTAITAYITVIIFLIFSYFQIKNNFKISLTYNKIFNTKKMFNLFNINSDIFIRTILLTFSFLWITYQSSKLGENYLAINTLLMQFIMLASFFLDAYAFSTEAVVGYTIGRRAKKLFLDVVTNSFQLSIFSGLLI